MSKARDLRTAPENNINMYELLSLFSYEKKSKYTELLLRLMKKSKNFKEHIKEIKENLTTTYDFISMEDLDTIPDLTIIYFYQFIINLFNQNDLISFYKFGEYNERGLIKQNDVTRYNSFEELHNAKNIADMAAQEKELEKQIKVVHSDDTWFVLRPLTYEASKKYGSNTKWCTTQENNSEYYTKYTKKGVLIYVINKENGYKVAAFKSLDKHEPEFSWWNQKDTRIDSLEAEITNEIREVIFKECTVDAVSNEILSNKIVKKDKPTNKKTTGRISNAIGRAIAEEADEPDSPSEIAEDSGVHRMTLVSQEDEDVREEPNVEMPRSQSLYEALRPSSNM
jgi:hypothetical protein